MVIDEITAKYAEEHTPQSPADTLLRDRALRA